MTTLLSDSFTRANSTTSPGSPDVGGPYTAVAGTWGIISNQLYTSASTANALLTAPGAADLRMTATLAVPGTNNDLVFRYRDASNYWYFGTGSGTNVVALLRMQAGTAIQPSTSVTVTAGATIKVEAVGRWILCYANGALVFALEDQYSISTDTTIGVRISSSTTDRFDDLFAETLSALPAPADLALYKGRDLATDDAGATA